MPLSLTANAINLRKLRERRRHERMKLIENATCQECGKPLPHDEHARLNRKFCSKSCGSRNWNRLWKERNGIAYNTAAYRACPRVDRDFTYAELEVRHCQGPGCNEPFEILGSYPGKYCSKSCKARAYRTRKREAMRCQ